MSKRENESGEASAPKVQKIDDALMKELEGIQGELGKIDTQCRDEQIEVQCRFDALKRKHFEGRGELLKKIPSFWKDVFLNFAGPSGLLVEQEIPILDHLVDVKLEDNLDKKGSHNFTFVFSENEFFKETEIKKEVMVKDEDNVHITVTPITWKKNILEGLEDQAKHSSFMHWLQCTDEDSEGDFGSVFREVVWEDVLTLYAQAVDVDDDDEEDDVEDEEEEGNEGEADEGEADEGEAGDE